MNRKRIHDVPAERLRARRDAAFQALGGDVMVLPGAPVQYASRDTDRPYRPDSDLFYLTGVVEPDTVAVLVGGEEPSWTLFVPARNPEAELWSGPRMGPEEAAERFEPDACHPLTELDSRLPDLLARGRSIHYRLGADDRIDRLVRAAVERARARGARTGTGPRGVVDPGGILDSRLPDLLARGRSIHYRLGADDRIDRLVRAAVERARARGARTGTGPRGVVDPGGILDELRLRKDAHEIERIRAAAGITLAGHRAAAAAARPGAGEWVVQAELEAAFLREGALPGFGTIVGSGANACVLHYRANADRIPEGGLVLVDAGAELGLYHGDVTRTYPAAGRFSDRQREAYDVVERARAAAVAAVRPGVRVAEVHEVAVRILLEGLVELDILEGEVGALRDAEAHKAYYPHQTSHWLGLDVHDPGDYAQAGVSRLLEPGMVLTVEPGLYFPLQGSEAARPWEGIGIRIEDDVLVTEDGHENLTAALPTAAPELEALLGESRAQAVEA